MEILVFFLALAVAAGADHRRREKAFLAAIEYEARRRANEPRMGKTVWLKGDL